jgi:hypothetical protein
MAALLMSGWTVLDEQRTFGIDTAGPVVDPGGLASWVTIVLVAVLTAGVVAGLIEGLLVRWTRSPWPARGFAVLYVVVASVAARFPMDFRLFGDRSPAALSDVTLFLFGFSMLVLGELALATAFLRVLKPADRPPSPGLRSALGGVQDAERDASAGWGGQNGTPRRTSTAERDTSAGWGAQNGTPRRG